MNFKLPFELLPCPESISGVTKMTQLDQTRVLEQNQEIAELQVSEADRLMKFAAKNESNEDALAYLWKFRRDILIDIMCDRTKYSWRKREIAHRELGLMGVNLKFITQDKVDV